MMDNDTTEAAWHQQETEEHQMQTGAIAKALADAQAEMANPPLDSANPHFRSKFASLAGVRNAVVPVLAKHGISLTQDLVTTDRGIACKTTLWHESGQSMAFGPLEIPATKPDAQGFGSAATYARRYSLMSIAGVVGDEDDDANAATGNPAPPQARAGIQTDPRGDLGKSVDTKVVNRWSKALIDQQDNPSRLVEIWDEIKPDHDLAVAVWAALPKALKDRVKDAREAA